MLSNYHNRRLLTFDRVIILTWLTQLRLLMQCLNCRGVGVEPPPPPSCLLNPPNKIPWDTLGDQFQPPAVVNDAESPVCNDNDNK
jgi:hypothetical protein